MRQSLPARRRLRELRVVFAKDRNRLKVQFEVPVVHVWTFVEGQITRFEAYIDNATMLAALRGG